MKKQFDLEDFVISLKNIKNDGILTGLQLFFFSYSWLKLKGFDVSHVYYNSQQFVDSKKVFIYDISEEYTMLDFKKMLLDGGYIKKYILDTLSDNPKVLYYVN